MLRCRRVDDRKPVKDSVARGDQTGQEGLVCLKLEAVMLREVIGRNFHDGFDTTQFLHLQEKAEPRLHTGQGGFSNQAIDHGRKVVSELFDVCGC